MEAQQQRPKFCELNNLASDLNGSSILFATDDWFAAAENMLKTSDAEWKEDLFDDCGKWMDGWETRRRRLPGHDWSIIKLGFPGIIHGVEFDTSHFTGNYPLKASLQGGRLSLQEEAMIPVRKNCFQNGHCASAEDIATVGKISEKWPTLVHRQPLSPGYPSTAHTYVPIESREVWTHLRLNIHPDGGMARLRIYGQVSRDFKSIVNANDKNSLLDFIAMENGGMCISVSNAHYGHPRNVILPGQPVSMKGGWETARRQDRPDIIIADPSTGVLQIPGHEQAIFRLGLTGKIKKLEIDTCHFKGNFPDTCKVDWIHLNSLAEESKLSEGGAQWKSLLAPKKLGPHQTVTFEGQDLVEDSNVHATHLRLTIAPDGGLARFRVWGIPNGINPLN